MPHSGISTKFVTSQRGRPRNVYQQRTQLRSMCRVCLTRSSVIMYDLEDKSALSEENYLVKNGVVSIHEALEKVTSSEIGLYGSFPRCICPICFSILKMSAKFIYQFEDSQSKLNNIFGKTSSVPLSQKVCDNRSQLNSPASVKAPVELIYGENKYSLTELLVVEDAEDGNNCEFQGFLNNLGKEVTATFADKSDIHSDKSTVADTDGQVSISLVNKDKIVPVKELQLDEETNVIQCVLAEDDSEDSDDGQEEILQLQIEDDDTDYDNIRIEQDVSCDEFIETEVRINDESEQYTKRGVRSKLRDIDVEAFIIENGVEKMDENSINQRNIIAQMKIVENKLDDIEDIFEKEVGYPCDICRKVFSFPDRLKSHKRRTHSTRAMKVYTCDICGYKNNTLSAHKHHRTKHFGKKWSCEICNKSYYTKAVLKVHMETHSNKRQHLCTVCGKGFNYSNALMYHMRLHTGEKNYICRYCGQRFRMPNSLNRHLRCHTGERPYKCQYCNKAFRSKGEVNCHETGHTGRRPYHCKYCRKGFSKTHNLKMHLLSHGGPHQCELCGRNFIEPAILTMHYKISHRDIEERKKEDEEDSN